MNEYSLDPSDVHKLNAAFGWLELGNEAEAKKEYDSLSVKARSRPEALEFEWQYYSRAENWTRCFSVGELLVAGFPERESGWIYRSFALHELKQTQAAFDQLAPALVRFNKNSTIPYNLACYCCQLGALDEARAWLVKAFKIDEANGQKGAHGQLALEDPDLQPLWEEIRQIAGATL